LAGLVVQLISWLMWLFFGWLKLILMSRSLVQTNSNLANFKFWREYISIEHNN
jgi:hypothetical protein